MTNNQIQSIKNLSFTQLNEWIKNRKYQDFRSKQVFQWIYKKKVISTEQMLNIPQKLRDEINNYGHFSLVEIANPDESIINSAKKYLFKLIDGNYIESVLIIEKDRRTVCLSSQIGCGLECSFCQTAKMGFLRNLTVGEIVDQILFISNDISEKITNVVYMGMGEPLLNYENVINSAIIINDKNGLNIGARKITISTSGIVPQIYMLADLKYQFKLAVSLNSGYNEKRSNIMPINNQFDLNSLIKAIKYYNSATNKKITIEYVLMKDINDSEYDAKMLLETLKDIHCKINLIPFNENETGFVRPTKETISKFSEIIKVEKDVTIRWSKGKEENGACGQLYFKKIFVKM